jgi:hypothetical protein
MSREKIHDKIDELLASISIHNSRLSLHAERLSQLDIDVLRKYCIDLYDQVNTLAIQGRLSPKPEPVIKGAVTPVTPPAKVEPVHAPTPIIEPEAEQKIVGKPIASTELKVEIQPDASPVAEVPKQPEEAPKEVDKPTPKAKPKYKQEARMETEISSLFEKFSSQPISSIPKAISVAKRFEYQSEFFDGDAKAYNAFMAKIDAAADRDDAFRIYHEVKEKSTWDNEELRDELKALLYRRYS